LLLTRHSSRSKAIYASHDAFLHLLSKFSPFAEDARRLADIDAPRALRQRVMSTPIVDKRRAADDLSTDQSCLAYAYQSFAEFLPARASHSKAPILELKLFGFGAASTIFAFISHLSIGYE